VSLAREPQAQPSVLGAAVRDRSAPFARTVFGAGSAGAAQDGNVAPLTLFVTSVL
jgi:hypothetical protein